MKKILLAIFFICIFLVTAFIFFTKTNNRKISVVSPLPDFLTRIINNQALSLNLWLPKIDENKQSGLQVSARSALVYDLSTGKTLYSKNPTEKMPMASLTKIMTAIIGLENKKSDDKYLVKKNDLVGEDSMGLSENEILNLDDLLYGLVLHSGNDAAETIADNYKNGRAGFIKAMNSRANSLGLSDTKFNDPSGLAGDGVQYSTAYDLLVMTNYALGFPEFAKVVQTFDFDIPKTSTHSEYDLENETNLLTSYPGVKGVKTGYTDEAGLCLVTYLDYDGHKIIGVILNSQNRIDDMKRLLDFSLKEESITPPNHG